MANEAAQAQLTDLLEAVQASMNSLSKAQEQWVQLTAEAASHDKRVTVVVNANGIVIETRFSDDVDELSYDEIAAAVTAAAQQAAAEVKAKAAELFTPMREGYAERPKLAELVPGMPDIVGMMPQIPEPSTAPPGSPDRNADANAERQKAAGQHGVTRPSW